eukprot:502333-Pleurochrysis_carterae.AAC.1
MFGLTAHSPWRVIVAILASDRCARRGASLLLLSLSASPLPFRPRSRALALQVAQFNSTNAVELIARAHQ